MQASALSLFVSRGNTQRCNIIGAQNSRNDKYGSAIFIRDDLKVKSISVTAANHVEVITAKLPDVVVHSVYKLPSDKFVLPPFGHKSLPQIVIGNFNSHKTIWGYDATDNNGIAVVQ